MKRSVLIMLAVMLMAPAIAQAKKTTYIVTDKRLNYVKLVEMDKKDIEERQVTHPIDIPEPKMREILAALKLSRAHMIGDKTDEMTIFGEQGLNYLSPALSRAFREVKPNEQVDVSYVVKDPLIVLRNDRLTMFTAWVSGTNLYFDFGKLYAKLTGDTDKRGNLSKILSSAKGLRVQLELQPGQQMAAVGSNVMVIDLNAAYATAAPAAGDAAPTAAADTKTKKSKSRKDKEAKTAEAAATSTDAAGATVAASSGQKNTEQRLEELDNLRKRNLISKKDYDEKKKEILKDL